MYVSCRDTASSTSARRRYSFREAVFSGWAEDGGMFVPEEIPVIPRATLSSWRQNAAAWTYSECCFAVLRRFVPRGQVPDEVLRGIEAANQPVDVSCEDVCDEIFDMVKPADPRFITVKDLIKSGVGDTVISMLIDTSDFLSFEQHEAEGEAGT